MIVQTFQWENILLIADQDNTVINVNGLPLLDNNNNQVELNNGEFIIIEGDKYSDRGNMYVNSFNPDDKIFAFQGLGAIWTAQNNQNRAAVVVSCSDSCFLFRTPRTRGDCQGAPGQRHSPG